MTNTHTHTHTHTQAKYSSLPAWRLGRRPVDDQAHRIDITGLPDSGRQVAAKAPESAMEGIPRDGNTQKEAAAAMLAHGRAIVGSVDPNNAVAGPDNA